MTALQPNEVSGSEYDLRPLHRELADEALEGAIFQAQGVRRFLTHGDDALAEMALSRARYFFGVALAEVRTITAENRRLVEAIGDTPDAAA